MTPLRFANSQRSGVAKKFWCKASVQHEKVKYFQSKKAPVAN
jgi:hypothetical protein